MGYKDDIKICSLGCRVTEGQYSAIAKYCQEVSMSMTELVELSIMAWISGDSKVDPDLRKYFLVKSAHMKKKMYEEQNEIIIRTAKELIEFEKEFMTLISHDASQNTIKSFIENKINSIISTIICLDSLDESKKLLTRLYEIIRKWRPNLVLTSNTKTLTLTFLGGSINMYNIYVNKKKIQSRILKQKKENIKDTPRYKKKLSEIKDDKKITILDTLIRPNTLKEPQTDEK